jgi:flagellar basal body P-ring protein FlgI
MAVFVFTNGFITVNGVDLSNHCSKITVTSAKDTVEVTAMGAVNKAYVLGLGDGTISADFFQDFAAASVDATLFPLHSAGSTFTVEVRPVNAARSATNPAYIMTALLPEYSPLDGSVGDAPSITVNFTNGAQTGLTRATA